MGFPAARLGNTTATGDAITGPGMPNVLIADVPAAVVGDLVAGNACAGSITVGEPTVLISGRPAADVHPYSGEPVTTAVAVGVLAGLIGP